MLFLCLDLSQLFQWLSYSFLVSTALFSPSGFCLVNELGLIPEHSGLLKMQPPSWLRGVSGRDKTQPHITGDTELPPGHTEGASPPSPTAQAGVAPDSGSWLPGVCLGADGKTKKRSRGWGFLLFAVSSVSSVTRPSGSYFLREENILPLTSEYLTIVPITHAMLLVSSRGEGARGTLNALVSCRWTAPRGRGQSSSPEQPLKWVCGHCCFP